MSFISLLRREKYYLLLFAQVLYLMIMPLLEQNLKSTGIFNVVGMTVIMLAGINIIDNRKLEVTGKVVTALFLLLTLFVQFGEFPILYFITFILFFIVFVLVDIRIIQMLLYAREIKFSLIAGSIAGYLMIGISLAFFIISFSALAGDVLSKPMDELGFHGIVYFAFVTMTTIGYGEITPVHPFIQTTAFMSGVLSQFYMAVVVAVIVGKLMNRKP
jgi:voltage-gated potassium channel